MDMFSIHSDTNGEVAVVTASGRIDSSTAPQLDAELTRVASEKNKIVLDLKDVEFLSSAGLRAIVKALQTLEPTGGGLKLVHVPEPIQSVMYTVGLSDMLKEYPSIHDAVTSF